RYASNAASSTGRLGPPASINRLASAEVAAASFAPADGNAVNAVNSHPATITEFMRFQNSRTRARRAEFTDISPDFSVLASSLVLGTSDRHRLPTIVDASLARFAGVKRNQNPTL